MNVVMLNSQIKLLVPILRVRYQTRLFLTYPKEIYIVTG